MKKYWLILITGGLLGLSPMNSPGSVSFSAGLDIQATTDFDAPLAPMGAWVSVGSYGRCWRPSGVAVGWRPYCNGQWVWTDCGWYWESDEPYAWACYHYGSWVNAPSYGWVWVPGTEWAPAWVTWRQGPDYVGWAPCGPHGAVAVEASFVFVDEHHFHDHINSHDVVFNDRAIYARTHVLNDNLRREDRAVNGRQERVVINNGPSVTQIQRDTGARFNAQPISEVTARTRVPDSVRRASPVRNGNEYQTPARAPEENYRQPTPNYRQPTSDFRQPATREENHTPDVAPPVQNREVAPPVYRQNVTPPARENQYQYRNLPEPVPAKPREAVPAAPREAVPNTPRQALPPYNHEREVTPPPAHENQYREVPPSAPDRSSGDVNRTPRQSEQAVPRTGAPPNGAVQGRTTTRPPVKPVPPAQEQKQQEKQQDQNGK